MGKLGTAFTPILTPAKTRLITLIDEATGLRYSIDIEDFFALVASGAKFSGDLITEGFLSIGTEKAAVISGGEITVAGSNYTIDTESSDPSDDLVTIIGGSVGYILSFRPIHNDRTIVVKDGIGNIHLGTHVPNAGGNIDYEMTHALDTLTLKLINHHVSGLVWVEIGRGDNQ